MRKKIKIYVLLFIVFAAGTSAVLLWNSSSYMKNQHFMDAQRELHQSYHHLVMTLESSLLELYRYEAGYSPDLDALVASVEELEEGIASISRSEASKELVGMIGGKVAEEVERFKSMVSRTVTSSEKAEKIASAKEASRIGNTIDSILNEAEKLSHRELDRVKNVNVSRVRAAQRIVAATIVIVFLFAVGGYFHARATVFRPFIRLIHFVEKVSEEPNFALRTEVPNDEDLALLARRFNEMMENLERWDEELKCNYEELRATNEELQSSYSNLEELTTELEEKSQEIYDANEELKSLDRLKNEFMQNVSHELRTPLTPVAGYLELFLNKDLGELSPIQVEIMTDMHQCCRRLAFIIDSLLEMVSLQEDYPTEKFELFDMGGVVKDIASQSAAEAKEKGICLAIDCPENLPSVNGAKKKVSLMLNHIIKNAVKFTNEGGSVSFAVEQPDEGRVVFTVTDSGIGISEERINKIFEPFMQLDSSLTRGYEGVGLGLALVKKVVEIHRGKIHVTSREGEGTTFIVSLPTA